MSLFVSKFIEWSISPKKHLTGREKLFRYVGSVFNASSFPLDCGFVEPISGEDTLSDEKPKPMQLPRPITTDVNSAMNQSELKANTCNRRQARENACKQSVIISRDWLWYLKFLLVEKVA